MWIQMGQFENLRKKARPFCIWKNRPVHQLWKAFLWIGDEFVLSIRRSDQDLIQFNSIIDNWTKKAGPFYQ